MSVDASAIMHSDHQSNPKLMHVDGLDVFSLHVHKSQ